MIRQLVVLSAELQKTHTINLENLMKKLKGTFSNFRKAPKI